MSQHPITIGLGEGKDYHQVSSGDGNSALLFHMYLFPKTTGVSTTVERTTVHALFKLIYYPPHKEGSVHNHLRDIQCMNLNAVGDSIETQVNKAFCLAGEWTGPIVAASEGLFWSR